MSRLSTLNDRQQRDRQVLRIIIIEGLANLTVLIAKTIIGLSTGSIAILGDALHSLTDASNNLVAYFVIRFSSMPADREHPYGHRKFETLAVFVLASILVVLSIQLAINALSGEQQPIRSSGLELAIMFGVLAINITVSSWQAYWARRLHSDILLADANHTFADVLITSSVILGWQLSSHGYPWADKICALGVSLFVLYLAFTLFRRALPVLTDRYAVDPQKVRERVEKIEGVEQVYHIRSRWMGNRRAIDLVISVDARLPTEQAHRISDEVEQVLASELDIDDASIHVEPHHRHAEQNSAD